MANATKRAVRSVLIESVVFQDHVEATKLLLSVYGISAYFHELPGFYLANPIAGVITGGCQVIPQLKDNILGAL